MLYSPHAMFILKKKTYNTNILSLKHVEDDLHGDRTEVEGEVLLVHAPGEG